MDSNVRAGSIPASSTNGRLAEWSNALDLKSSILKGIVGSNPTSSAITFFDNMGLTGFDW